MVVTNNQVACEPFATRSVVTAVKSNFAVAQQKRTLTGLQVLIADVDGKFPVGSTVFVRSDQCNAPWASEEYDVGAAPFILVPFASIQLVRSAVGR